MRNNPTSRYQNENSDLSMPHRGYRLVEIKRPEQIVLRRSYPAQ